MNPNSYAGMIPENPDDVAVYFVYGTLCQGQCRQHCWPATPLGVHPAWVQGTLFGREDYPALRPGNQRVGGECWFFAKRDAERVTEVLDEIEVTNQPGHPNLYDRIELQANLVSTSHLQPANVPAFPQTWTASAYHYATDPLLDGFERLTEQETVLGKFSVWPAEKWRSMSVL
ncbi:MAG: hypothetical protein CMM00_09090 [Rhodopirellula sp.]|nr:hypothetical protein [Rhodopirellula sp.]